MRAWVGPLIAHRILSREARLTSRQAKRETGEGRGFRGRPEKEKRVKIETQTFGWIKGEEEREE